MPTITISITITVYKLTYSVIQNSDVLSYSQAQGKTAFLFYSEWEAGTFLFHLKMTND